MSNSQHILVVDDDPRIRTMLRRYLEGEGFTITEVAEGAAMRSAFAKGDVDLVLLDLMLGTEDGLALAREIRQRGATPIIMLTGKGDMIDRVVGLEAGADDYIAKPFHLREVLARIRTVLRRAPATASIPAPAAALSAEPTAGVLTFEGWRMDLDRRELRQSSGETVSLTSGEFELLRVFATHPNRVLSRDQLMDLVKGREWEAYDRAMDTQIVRLRKKIEADPARPMLIKTVRGAGYIFARNVTRGS
ncbi:MAG TPA: response regulator [Stellaceae bacterium]|jgi:DNA-binding response OmpR family regulator|nr:response regulator [Stellaceae bacterium]